MITLKGRFLLSSGPAKLNPFAGSLLFECTQTIEHIIVNPKNDTNINPTHEMELVGKYLDSTLRGLKVFEADSAKSLSQVPVTMGSVSSSEVNEVFEYFVGSITSFSQCFKLKNGPAVFLTLSLNSGTRVACADKNEARLMLLRDAVQWVQYLHLGDLVEVNNVVRFRWKASASGISQSQSGASQGQSNTQDSIGLSEQNSFYIDHPGNITILQQSIRFMHNTSTSTHPTSAKDLLHPATLLQKEQYANTEFSQLVGTVRSVHPSGWLELVDVTLYSKPGCNEYSGDMSTGNNNNNDKGDQQFDIYDVDSNPAESNSQFHPSNETVTKCTSTTIHLPLTILYLSHHSIQHLRLTALGVSVRKTATILVHNVISVYLYGKNKGFTTTCRSNIHILRFAGNSHFISADSTHCSVGMNMSKEIKNGCVLYAVWREETRRKLAQCVGSDLLLQTHVYEALVLQFESLATFVIPDKTTSDKRESGRVREVLALSTIPVQEELYNLPYTLLYTIRNGIDADFIGNSLPQVYSVSRVIAKLLHMHASSRPYCHANVYGLYQYDLCGVQQSFSYWSQYHHTNNITRLLRRNVVLLGTVVYVCVPYLSHDGNNSNQPTSMHCARLRIIDASGKGLTVVVNNIDADFCEYLKTICSVRLACTGNEAATLCSSCSLYKRSPTPTIMHNTATDNVRRSSEYCSPCICNTHPSKPPLHTTHAKPAIQTTSSKPNPLYVSIHYPLGLLEKQPSLTISTDTVSVGPLAPELEYKYFVMAEQKHVSFYNASVNDNGASEKSCLKKKTDQPVDQPAHNLLTTVRQILTTNLFQNKHKYVPLLYCMVVNKQVLSVEYKNATNHHAHEHTTTTTSTSVQSNIGDNGSRYKKRRLETQYSVCESVEYSDRLNNITTTSALATSSVATTTQAQNTVYNAYSRATAVHSSNGTSNNTSTFNATVINSNQTAKKCCLTVRDVHFPDTINLYIPLTYVSDVHVGHIVYISDLYACIPESRKKVYLKLTEENKTKIDIVGMASGTQLQTLCELSHTIPDPRFIDTMYTHNAHYSVYNGSTGITNTTGNSFNQNNNLPDTMKHKMPYTLHSIYEHYIHAPPSTTISQLTPQCSYNRAVYALTGQVTFIRKLHITLRCTNCSSSAKRCNRLGGYVCTKCTACYTIMPLWEVYIAFDDGTGECNMHIEGEQVFNVIRAKYDMCSKVLAQVRKLVDNYVHKYGSLLYDAFDQSVSEYNKPYSEVVQATYNATNMATTTINAESGTTDGASATAAPPLQYTSRSNMIFDMPLSERTNCLTSFIDLNTNSSNTKIPLILRSYIQLVSYSTLFSVYCRVDYNTGTSVSSTSENISSNTNNANINTSLGKSKREVKLQRNNVDKPYLAYFVSRPTYSGTKLSMQGLFARELHGESLNNRSWELLKKLQA